MNSASWHGAASTKDLAETKSVGALPTQNGSLLDGLGVRDREAGVALRATFIVGPAQCHSTGFR